MHDLLLPIQINHSLCPICVTLAAVSQSGKHLGLTFINPCTKRVLITLYGRENEALISD